MNRTRWRQYGKFLICILVSAGLLTFLLTNVDMERMSGVLRKARWFWLVMAMIFTCGLPICSVYRWLGVIQAQENINISFVVALRAVMLAFALNSFLPSKAGDMAKAFYLKQHGGISVGISTVIIERLVDLAVLGLFGIVGFALTGELWGLLTGAVLLGGVAFLFCVFLWLPINKIPLPGKLRPVMDKMRNTINSWAHHRKAIMRTVLGSFGVWTLGGLIVCSLISALSQPLSWGYAYAIYPLSVLAGLLPITISGIGTRDSAFVALLSTHMPVEEATLVGIGYTFFAYWMLSLISFPVVFREIMTYFRYHGYQNKNEDQKQV